MNLQDGISNCLNGLVSEQDEAAIAWLLSSDEPAIRALARRELLNEEVAPVAGGPRVDILLHHKTVGHPYRKWTGVHWRLIALAELGVDRPWNGCVSSPTWCSPGCRA